MEANMDKVQFKNALDYYNDIVAIRSRYNIQVDKQQMIKTMTKNVNSTKFKQDCGALEGGKIGLQHTLRQDQGHTEAKQVKK